MKSSIVVAFSLLIGVAVVTPANASGSARCEVCGTGGGAENFSSFDGGFGEVCVPLTGNGFGWDNCTVYYPGGMGYSFCDVHGQAECRNGEELALLTGVDGYLVPGGLSTSQREGLLHDGAARRPCDGAIVARQFSSEQASSNAGSTSTISL